MNAKPYDRAVLVAEYQQYRAEHNRAPNPWNTPNAREEAGYHLQFSDPLGLFDNLAPRDVGPWWTGVRALIATVLEGGAA